MRGWIIALRAIGVAWACGGRLFTGVLRRAREAATELRSFREELFIP